MNLSVPEQIAWSVGNAPVNLAWDSARMTAPGGYERMSGRVTGHLQMRRMKQGAVVTGVRPNGKILYQGTVVSMPKIVNGVAFIEAEGYQEVLRRRTKRLPYIISDASQWSAANELPFDYPCHQKYTLQSKNDGIGWLIDTSTYATNDRAGYGLYVPNQNIQRIRCILRKTGNNADFDLELRGTDDVAAGPAVVLTRTLGAGNPDGTALNMVMNGKNTAILNVIYSAGGGAGTKDRFMLQDLVACCIADDNDWVTSQVASDVAGRMDFGDDVTTSGTEIEALDWTSSWDELLNYMAAIEDWTWLVTEDTVSSKPKAAQLTFRPWGNKTWHTTLDQSEENLTVAPLYNRVTVLYERPEGVPQHAVFDPSDIDVTDPIPDLTYEYPDQPVMENPQRSTHLVNRIGNRLLRRVIVPRLVGNIKVAGLLRGAPFDIKAGDLLQIDDYLPKVAPQRIASVTYNADGTADCTLERSFDIAGMLYRLTAHRRRTTAHSWGSGHRG